jgi:hypothetical protein
VRPHPPLRHIPARDAHKGMLVWVEGASHRIVDVRTRLGSDLREMSYLLLESERHVLQLAFAPFAAISLIDE